jgi:nifR3 family TIM-barrel protein
VDREEPELEGTGSPGPGSYSGRCVSDMNRDVPVAAQGEFAPLKLGELEVWPPVVLAPMAGVTNLAFRSLCREYGAGLYVSEMITARGFLMGNRLTALLASSSPDEHPRSVQVYGSDPKDLGEMVAALVAEGVDHLDINFGCPVPKVTKTGGGSAIPVKPRLVERLVRAMVSNAGDVPVSVKMRKGVDQDLITFEDAGRAAEAAGASAVGLHARTAAELYSGDADWEAIARLKSILSVPVLGNGDIWESWDALRMMRETGCDAVIIGRACLGRPWLFGELVSVFNGEEPAPPPNFGEILDILLDHARRLCDLFGPVMGIRQVRKWTTWYTKGFRNSAAVRGELTRVATFEELEALLRRLDRGEPFPAQALRMGRCKGNKSQKVKLPEGYLDNRDDDTPPKGPNSLDEIRAWEQALNGG